MNYQLYVLLTSYILSQAAPSEVYDLTIDGNLLLTDLKGGDSIIVDENLLQILQETESPFPSIYCHVNAFKKGQQAQSTIPCSTANYILRVNEYFAPNQTLVEQMPFIFHIMQPQYYDLLVYYCRSNSIPYKPEQGTKDEVITVTIGRYFINHILFGCLDTYQIASTTANRTAKVLPHDLQYSYTGAEMSAFKSFCMKKLNKFEEKKGGDPNIQEVILFEARSFLIHKSCYDAYKDMYNMTISSQPQLTKYYFYIMSKYDLSHLFKWCKSQGINMKSGDTKKIMIHGVMRDFSKECYDAHYQVVKQSEGRIPMDGLSDHIKYSEMTHDLKSILHQWCQDVGVNMANDELVPFGKSPDDKYSRTCMRAYRAKVNTWIDSKRVTKETYDDMIKVCDYMKLARDDHLKTSILVFEPTEEEFDINDESLYIPLPISKVCLESYRFYKHGQSFINEETFNPGSHTLLTSEFIDVMFLARKVGVLAIMGPLISSLAHGFAYKSLCTYFRHCVEPDIISGFYADE